MPDSPPPQPDSKRLFDLLLGLKMEPEGAYTFTQEVGNMAAANLIARFESKLDAQGSRFESKLDAQGSRFDSRLDAQNTKIDAQSTQTASLKSEIASIRWMIGLGFTLLALLITLLRFLG